MRHLRPVYLVLLLPLTAALAFLPGCEGSALTDKGKKPSSGGMEDEVAPPRVGIVPTSYGTITGKVTYDGTPPAAKQQDFGPNGPCCQAFGKDEWENFDLTWVVDKSGGVKNVFVILQPPKGKFFVIPKNQQEPKEKLVTVHQPHCQFIPRTFLMFPSFFNPETKTDEETGQKLKILNDAVCNHNFAMQVDIDLNLARGGILSPGKQEDMNLRPQDQPITIGCNIHSWMRSFGFILDHPYAAITNDDGTFVIPNAPLGVPLQVVCWHEAAAPKFFNGGVNGTTETLKDKQALNFLVRAP